MWWQIFIGVAITFIITIVLRSFSLLIAKLSKLFEKVGSFFKSFNKDKLLKYIKSLCKLIINCFMLIISPDYLLAKLRKSRFSKDGEDREDTESEKTRKRKKYIELWNKFNLFISFVLAVTTYCVIMFSKNEMAGNIFFGLIVYRTLSRTLEINISFLKDIVDKDKKSGLEKHDRIRLALTSLLEEVFLFVGVYAFFSLCWAYPLLGGLHSFILSPFGLDSVKVCGCKCDNVCNWKDVLFKFISIYQVICTVILITLSFAGYISDSKKDADGRDS